MKYYLLISCALLTSCTLEDQSKGLSIEPDVLSSTLKTSDGSKVTSIPADSVSTLQVTAALGPNVTIDQEVTFTTDQGWFVGADPKTPKSIKTTTSLKTATVMLIPDTNPNPSVGITASVTTGTQTFPVTKQIKFEASLPTDFYLSSDKYIVVPDGVTTATVTILTTHGVNEPRVSDGVIVNLIKSKSYPDSVSVDVVPFAKLMKGTATFSIKSTNTKNGIVTMTAELADNKSVTKQISVKFLK